MITSKEIPLYSSIFIYQAAILCRQLLKTQTSDRRGLAYFAFNSSKELLYSYVSSKAILYSEFIVATKLHACYSTYIPPHPIRSIAESVFIFYSYILIRNKVSSFYSKLVIWLSECKARFIYFKYRLGI